MKYGLKDTAVVPILWFQNRCQESNSISSLTNTNTSATSPSSPVHWISHTFSFSLSPHVTWLVVSFDPLSSS